MAYPTIAMGTKVFIMINLLTIFALLLALGGFVQIFDTLGSCWETDKISILFRRSHHLILTINLKSHIFRKWVLQKKKIYIFIVMFNVVLIKNQSVYLSPFPSPSLSVISSSYS